MVRHFPSLFAALKIMRLMFDRSSFIHIDGIWKSYYLDRPSDKNGQYVPWINSSFRRFIESRLAAHFNVLEFGSGSSTFYLQDKVNAIVTIEHSKLWANKVRDNIKKNVMLIDADQNNHQQYIYSANKSTISNFHIIFVDAIYRKECCEYSITKLCPDGVVILDDSSRSDYYDIHAFFKLNNFKSISISGVKPCGYGIDETTVFYKPNNCLGI